MIFASFLLCSKQKKHFSIINSSWFLFLTLNFKEVLWRFPLPGMLLYQFQYLQIFTDKQMKGHCKSAQTPKRVQDPSHTVQLQHIKSPVAFNKFTACKKNTILNFANASASCQHCWPVTGANMREFDNEIPFGAPFPNQRLWRCKWA